MSNIDPTAVDAPSPIPLNAASFTRLAIGLLAGYLGKLGLDGNQSAAVASAVVTILLAAWTLWKNHRAAKKLAVAMATPAVKVVTPSGDRVPPALVSLLMVALVVVAATHSLTACATKPLAPAGSQLGLLQGDTALDASYNIAIQAYIQNAASIPEATKARIRPLIPKAYAAVRAVDDAQRLGSAADLTGQIAAAQGLISQISAAAHGN